MTDQFKLIISAQRSTNLLQYAPLTAPGVTINPQGQIEYEFTVPDNRVLFRLQVQQRSSEKRQLNHGWTRINADEEAVTSLESFTSKESCSRPGISVFICGFHSSA